MQHDVFFTLSLASERLGKTRRDLVVMLLMKIMRDVDRFQGGFTLVRYQKRDPLKRWRCFSISFRTDEYEFFTDLRKLGKFSVSYLVAMAVERYLDELLDGKKRHNYFRFTHYTIGQRIENDILCWEFYWGDPADTPKALKGTKIHRRTSTPPA
jgi:hypothetical protein